MLKDQFSQILQEFGFCLGEDLALSSLDDTCVIKVDDDVLVNVQYLNASDVIILFSPLGALAQDDEQVGAKALDLLRLNELNAEAGRVTLMYDAEAELVLAADRRSAFNVASVDEFAAWLEVLVSAVRATRAYFAEHYPREAEA
ncbi:MAG: type III secretion system chaperone [Succinivibrio sp.]|nr:type III secretion system chaperone [Succinivibrio sp.]